MSFGLGHGRTLDPGEIGIEMTTLPKLPDAATVEESRAALGFDPRGWFAQPSRRFEIEIGSGKGTFLLQQAELEPEVNFLGIEWANEFWRYAADRIRRRGLANVRLLRGDATEFIRARVPDGIAAVIHLYFSDPWPKARHHKRRVVQDHTLREFHRVLAPGGELRIVTDHDELWQWDVEHAARAAGLFERRDFARPASAGAGELVGTNFERKFRREGRPFHAMTLVRR
ncbi:MAG: tRNA (guanosine(46)-N7)-methyltransferase TrmB [Planctomycetota bacterium]